MYTSPKAGALVNEEAYCDAVDKSYVSLHKYIPFNFQLKNCYKNNKSTVLSLMVTSKLESVLADFASRLLPLLGFRHSATAPERLLVPAPEFE